jgi:polar amino acid transport system substrate-binding protein
VTTRRLATVATVAVAFVLTGCSGTPAATGAAPSASAAAPTSASAGAPSASVAGFTTGSTLDAIRAKGVLTIGVTDDPPWSVSNVTTIGIGIIPEIVTEFAKREGLGRIDSVSMPFGQMVQATSSGRIDMIGETIFNTPERAQVIDFAEPLFFNPATLIVPPGNPKNLHQHSDFDHGVSVCVIEGSLYLQDVEADRAKGQDVKSIVLDTNDACTNAVVAGQADAALVDATQAELAKKTKPDLAFDIIREFKNPDLSKVISSVGFNANGDDLREAFNARFLEMTKEGLIDQILTKYGLTPALFVVNQADPEYRK